MRYFSFICRSCETAAKTHGYFEEIANLSQKIERDQSIEAWDKFLPSPFIKKNLGRFRAIAEKRVLGDDIVVIFLTVLPRGAADYQKFIADPSAFFKGMSPADAELLQYLEKRKPEVKQQLTRPNDTEFSYLYETKGKLDISDGVVFESKDWVERMSNARIQEYLVRYYDLLNQLIDPEKAEHTVAVSQNSPAKVLYKFDSAHNRLFLVAPLLGDAEEAESILRSRYAQVLGAQDGTIANEELLKISGRSYPMLIFAHDESAWKAIQKNTEGNLAMSPEETFILNAIQYSDDMARRAYPLFINGRPGSGKSTILQYLFAERLYLHLIKDQSQRLPFPPLFLTYSERLIQQAKKSVKTILNCNAEYLAEKIDLESPDSRQIFESSFGEFHQFLLNLLPKEEKKRFPYEKRMDFPRFRRAWHEASKSDPDPTVRSLSAELVWHVIRTYIKGMRDDSGNPLDPDLYAELPAKQHTVTHATYERIFSRAWEKWYKIKSEKEGWWDSQDLTRGAIDTMGAGLSRFPAIFCDEAQDFTKLELELILKLSLFARRHIPPADLRRIPFAFAGDPFQTLNPTGFDWGAVQAGFHEKVVQELDRASLAKLEFNYQELSFNYRSTKNIVGFCNLLQLVRGIVFDIKDLKPQRSWFDEDAPMPALFDISDPSCQKSLEEQSEIVIILPCQEGEEESYVQQDPFLRRIGGSAFQARNFLSPMSAKGLEFSRVVLYKFGDECIRNYQKLLHPLESKAPHTVDPEKSLPLEYFMNRLYVAASRAKKRLFVVDTSDAINQFWKTDHLRSLDALVNQYSAATKHAWSAEDLSYMQPGFDESWSADRDDPLKLAEVFREAGIAERDPYKLRLAENTYSRSGRDQEALECRAIRLEFEDNLTEAGHAYMKLGKSDRAMRCYWKARNYNELRGKREFADTVEQRAADFMAGGRSSTECEKFLEYLHDHGIQHHKDRLISDNQWPAIIETLLDRVSQSTFDKKKWPHIYGMFTAIQESGVDFDITKGLGEIAYKARMFEHAIRIWESTDGLQRDRKEYLEAKSNTAAFPEVCRWLNRLGKHNDILQKWETNKSTALSTDDAQIIATAFVSQNLLDQAMEFLHKYPSQVVLRKLVDMPATKKNEEVQKQALSLLITVTVKDGSIRDAMSLVGNQKPGPRGDAALSAFLRRVALYDQVQLQSHGLQTTVQAFLKKHLIDSYGEFKVELSVAGAAIENAGKIIDSLEFYEMIWKTRKIPATPNEIAFARQRWLRCKYRFGSYLAERRSDSEHARHKQEADERAAEWRVAIKDIPEVIAVEEPIGEPASALPTIPDIDEDRRHIIEMLKGKEWSVERISQSLGLDPDLVAGVVGDRKEDTSG